MKNILWFGDCLHHMQSIPSGKINLICCDLPYGVTKNKWDFVIPMDDLWREYERVISPNGAIVLFGQGKFSARLMLSNEKLHRYNLVWQKTTPTGHLNAKRMPLRIHEDILVFYKKLPTYNPQKTTGHERKVSTANHKRNSKKTTNYGKHGLTGYDSTERYPTSVLTFPTDKQKSALHPTQKPLALIEYLVKTYSNEGDWVLDNTCGSNTTGLACLNLGRNYIGIEKDPRMYGIAEQRVGVHNITKGIMNEKTIKGEFTISGLNRRKVRARGRLVPATDILITHEGAKYGGLLFGNPGLRMGHAYKGTVTLKHHHKYGWQVKKTKLELI